MPPEPKIPLHEILEMVALQLGADEVRPDDRLVEELGAESADLLNLVVALEERYGIEIAEEEIPSLTTPKEAHARVCAALAGSRRTPAEGAE